MKRLIYVTITSIISIILIRCALLPSTESQKLIMGFDPSDFVIIEEEDTHGGFHGDGEYFLTLDCSSDPDRARQIVADWTPLPLSNNLELLMYGGQKEYAVYHGWVEERWTKVENGVYRFYNYHTENTDPSDDSGLFSDSSYNFDIAIYDFDNDTLYYYELDT